MRPCLRPFDLIHNVTRPPAGRSSGAAERREAHTSNAQAQVREQRMMLCNRKHHSGLDRNTFFMDVMDME